VYHGTYGDFSAFKKRTGDIGMHFGTAGAASDRVATAVPHRGNKDGKTISASVMPVYLSIKNPIRMEDSGFWNIENMASSLVEIFPNDKARIGDGFNKNRGLQSTKDIREFLQSKGHDGVVYRNTGEVAGSEPFRAQIAVARAAMIGVFPKGKNSFSFADQQVPEYKAWSAAEKAYAAHREASTEDSYIAFDAAQVKSATGNSGAFDGTNPDIRQSRAGYANRDDPFAAGYSRLEGRKLAMEVRIEDTGQTATLRTDSAQYMRELDGRLDTARRLAGCIAR